MDLGKVNVGWHDNIDDQIHVQPDDYLQPQQQSGDVNPVVCT